MMYSKALPLEMATYFREQTDAAVTRWKETSPKDASPWQMCPTPFSQLLHTSNQAEQGGRGRPVPRYEDDRSLAALEGSGGAAEHTAETVVAASGWPLEPSKPAGPYVDMTHLGILANAPVEAG